MYIYLYIEAVCFSLNRVDGSTHLTHWAGRFPAFLERDWGPLSVW